MLRVDLPLIPDPEQARSWLEDELARADYSTDSSPLTRAIRWLISTFLDAVVPGVGRLPLGTVVLASALLLAVFVLAAVIMVPARRRARSSEVFAEGVRSLDEARRASHDAAAREDWDEACVWEFRRLVLELEARGLLHVAPGLTANEAAERAGRAVPLLGPGIAGAARDFDDMRYGGAHGSGDTWRRWRTLADRVGE